LLDTHVDLALCVGALLAFSCSNQNGGTSDPKPSHAVEAPAAAVTHDAAAGAQPATTGRKTVDLRVEPDPSVAPLAGADTSPLPATALVRYQVISHGPRCAGNYRFLMHQDGRLFFQQNKSGGNCGRGKPFDEPFAAEPTKTMPAEWVAELKKLIVQQGFFDLAAGYRATREGRGGAMEIMDVSLDGKTHRVVIQRLGHPAVEAISELVMAAVYE